MSGGRIVVSEQRTNLQNRSLHKFCEMLAEELNNAGYDMKATLKEDAEIPWNKDLVKEFLWKPIQKAMVDKTSTTEMDTTDPSKIHEVLMRHLGSKLGINYIDWPSQR